MERFKIEAIETNIDVYPPIFKGTIYNAINEILRLDTHPTSKDYIIEVEEYDQIITWGNPTTSFKTYQVPAYLFKKVDEYPDRCECGQDKTWQHLYKKNCPKDKHSTWCKVYKI